MNKRRRKKEIVKQIKNLVEKDADFVYFKSYNSAGLPESYLLPLIQPILSINISPDSVPAVDISAGIINLQMVKFYSHIK